MVTELRDLGDKKTVVVYTDERETINKLRARRNCFKINTYEQQQNKDTVTVGFDFYFPKSESKALLKLAGVKK